jgi:hypothetical protein
MNHNEPGFLQETIEGRPSSEIPVRAFVRQKGKDPFAKSVERRLCGDKKYAYILTVGIPFRSALSDSIADQLAR